MIIIKGYIESARNFGGEIWMHTCVPSREETGITAHIVFASARGNIRGQCNWWKPVLRLLTLDVDLVNHPQKARSNLKLHREKT